MRNEGVQNHSWASASVFRHSSSQSGTGAFGLGLLIPVPNWFRHRYMFSFRCRTDRMPDSPTFRNSIKLLGKLLYGPFKGIFWGGQKSNLPAFSKLNRVNCNDMYREKSALYLFFLADLFSFRELWKTTWKCRLKATMIIYKIPIPYSLRG